MHDETKNEKTTQENKVVAAEEAADATDSAPVLEEAVAPVEEPVVEEVAVELNLTILPDDESFLSALSITAEQQVDDMSIRAGVKAFLFDDRGFFQLPFILKDKIIKAAKAAKTPIDGTKVKELCDLVIKRKYGQILAAVNCQGAASFIGMEERQELIKDVKEKVMPAMQDFHHTLRNFLEGLRDSVSSEIALATMLGKVDDDLKELTAEPVDLLPLKNAAELIVIAANEAFSGWGRAAARLLAADALNMKKVLENPDLPGYAGYLSREDMIQDLGAEVNNVDMQQEQGLGAFVIFALRLHRTNDPATQMALTKRLKMIDRRINWNKV